ncbi:DedA family protein [Micromonospora radicis]|uniref:DedA family protein n=1 Tax=Micromonospora radicis TaxID=1894971 RepID=A0A418MY23_9ACTN|nr:DedA family protein [Micromonospora radicis]
MLAVLAALPPVAVLALVFLLPALESSTLLGLFVPGETAVLVGGVVAHLGGLPLWAVIVVAAAGACLGDQVGYLLGRRYGPAVLARAPAVARRHLDLDRARRLVATRGAAAVVIGRWVAVLRVLVPLFSGASGMSRSTFGWANVAGGSVWATTVVLLGYLGSASYRYLEHELGIGTHVLLALLVVGALLALWRHHRRRRPTGPAR